MAFNTCHASGIPVPSWECGRGADLTSAPCTVGAVFNIQAQTAGLTNVQIGPNQPDKGQYKTPEECASACWGEPEGANACTAFSFEKERFTCTFYTSDQYGSCPMPTGVGSKTVGAVKSSSWQN